MATASSLMTVEEFLALPDSDKVERWLIDGVLKEFKMSKRSPQHAAALTQVARILGNWCAAKPAPRCKTFTGDIYFLLGRAPDRSVGIDVAVISPAQVAALLTDADLIDGVPLLAVEVVSPSDRWARVQKKVALYVDSGTPQTWLVDPYGKTVTVYRPKARPVLYSESEVVTGDPELPGLAVTVSDLFD